MVLIINQVWDLLGWIFGEPLLLTSANSRRLLLLDLDSTVEVHSTVGHVSGSFRLLLAIQSFDECILSAHPVPGMGLCQKRQGLSSHRACRPAEID